MRFFTFLPAAALFETSIAGYVLQDDYMADFFGSFDFFTGPDPTQGFVDYVDQATAQNTGLINTTSTSVVQWGVDTKNPTPEGRPSIRIESKKTYDSGLIVLDVAHMPFGCGTWPAFWSYGPNWPQNGEIDILEGVNDQTNNGMTLHTGPGCQIGEDRTIFSGTVESNNCDINAAGQSQNKGCSIEHPSTNSYGAGLNAIGGGVYATHWTNEAISVFFFPRDAIPADALGDSPNPSGWGKPAAKFTGGCNIPQFIKQQKLVFDTTFCGQWAGSQDVWDASTCKAKAPTCTEYVRDNPQAFVEAYWTINSLKVYQDDGQQVPGTPGPTPSAGNPPIGNGSTPVPAVSGPPQVPVSSAPSIPIQSPPPGVNTPLPASGVFPGTPIASPTPVPSPPNENTPPVPDFNRPATPIEDQIPSRIGANAMVGFKWPGGGGEGGGNNDNKPPNSTPTPSSLPGAPVQNSTTTPPQNLAAVLQEDAPASAPNRAAPPNRVVADKIVHDVKAAYETPAPDSKKARLARHVREHRHRLARRGAGT